MSMRFPVYESLYFSNRNVQDILGILEEIKNAPGMPKKSFESYQVEIRYLRSHATQDVLEVMNDKEIYEMAKLGRQKKAYDDRIRDLDDVYFEVQHREEERRKQGLPSLIGVLPPNHHTAEAEEVSLASTPSESIQSGNRINSRAYGTHGKRSTRASRRSRKREKAS